MQFRPSNRARWYLWSLFRVLLTTLSSALAWPNSSLAEQIPLDAAPPVTLAQAPELERARTEFQRDEQTLRREMDQVERESSRAHQRLIVRGRAYVRMSRAGLLPVVDGLHALFTHATRLEWLYATLLRDLQLTRELAERRRALEVSLTALASRGALLELRERTVLAAQTALLEAQDRQLAFQRAFQTSSAPQYAAVYGAGAGPADPGELTLGFVTMKGRLPFPVTGRAEIRTSRRLGTKGTGLEMLAPAGTPVRSVYPGKVAFAERHPDYGNSIVLDHGGGYFTLSANLEGMDVSEGQHVSVGARLGTVGSGPAGVLLYFEVRLGTEALNAVEWFGL